jgi:hypothetical protein
VLGPDLLILLVMKQCTIEQDLRRVDHTNHATLAMLALGAVEPDRGRCVLDLVGKDLLCCGVHRGGSNVSGPETVGHRRAGLSKSALSNAVVFRPEVVRDSITLSSDDAVRHEDESARLVRDGDLVVYRSSGADKSSGCEES